MVEDFYSPGFVWGGGLMLDENGEGIFMTEISPEMNEIREFYARQLKAVNHKRKRTSAYIALTSSLMQGAYCARNCFWKAIKSAERLSQHLMELANENQDPDSIEALALQASYGEVSI